MRAASGHEGSGAQPLPDEVMPDHPGVQVQTLFEGAARPMADVSEAQRRTLRLLFATQVLGGIGLAIGFSVGALLAADLVGVGASGLAQSAAVVGGALLAVPATRVVRRFGRRPSLAAVYLLAALGGFVVVTAAIAGSAPLLFFGFFLFGGGTTASLQARYAAIDLSPPAVRGRHLSIVVWATTLGAVAGPNLARPAGIALEGYGVPTLAAPFFFSSVLFVLAATLLALLLRPDPLMLARSLRDDEATGSLPERSLGMAAAVRHVSRHPGARLGIAATAVGHLVMVGVMAMTPVHILDAGHDAVQTLRIVGIVLSLHIAGMFAFAPVTGWLTDRVGRRPVILTGVALLLVACAVAGTAGHDNVRLAIGLTILGLGWSCTMVAGSTLLNDSVSAALLPSAQGLSDLTMGLAAAAAGAMSGLVLQAWGYPVLAILAAAATLPLVALALGSDRAAPARYGPGIGSR
jgi:MFS family permease